MILQIYRFLFLATLLLSFPVYGLHILLTNDDGIDGIAAGGTSVLRQVLIAAGHTVTTATPASNRSACGTGIDIVGPLQIQPNPFPVVRANTVSGGANPIYTVEQRLIGDVSTVPPYGATTATSVLIGLAILKQSAIVPDIIVSGINIGPNLGPITINSGTVGGALASISSLFPDAGIPAIAVSCGITDNSADQLTVITNCATFIAQLIATFECHPLSNTALFPNDVALNINYPGVLENQIAGVALTKQGKIYYPFPFQAGFARYVATNAGPGFQEFTIPVEVVSVDKPGKKHEDGTAVNKNYISITPIEIDLTARDKKFKVFSHTIKKLNRDIQNNN